jgi:hypothetical protein
MSDNLISKEKLFNSRPEWLNENMPDKEKSTYNKGWNACNHLWLDTIDEQPTAYDVDEKCEELMRSSYEAYGGGNHAVGLNRAINIVKGGVSDD